MRSYYRVMLGEKRRYANECFEGHFIGTDYDFEDLTGKLTEDLSTFNRQFIPVYLADPNRKKRGAQTACEATWTVSKGIKTGDIVLCRGRSSRYRVGEVCGDYYYARGKTLFHRRPVTWRDETIDESAMSAGLKNSMARRVTARNITEYHKEIEKLIPPVPIESRLQHFEEQQAEFEKHQGEDEAASVELPFDQDGVDERQRTNRAILERLGQPQFRRKLLRAYRQQCAVSGCQVVWALEAAHITPYRGARMNAISNGLLLRADIHTLFDLALISINPSEMTIRVSSRLAGSLYADFHGKRLTLPTESSSQPSPVALQAHYASFHAAEAKPY